MKSSQRLTTMSRHLLVLVPLLVLVACSDTPRQRSTSDIADRTCDAYVVTSADSGERPSDRVERQQCLLDAFPLATGRSSRGHSGAAGWNC